MKSMAQMIVGVAVRRTAGLYHKNICQAAPAGLVLAEEDIEIGTRTERSA